MHSIIPNIILLSVITQSADELNVVELTQLFQAANLKKSNFTNLSKEKLKYLKRKKFRYVLESGSTWHSGSIVDSLS
jgi:hypothetical protein